MRVVFTVWPAPAHLYPVVPLAWALQSAGHEVCVASHPVLTEAIVSAGLTPVPVGDPAVPPMGPGKPYPAERARLDELTSRLALDPAQRDPWDIFYQFMMPAIWDFHPAGAPSDQPRPGVDDLVAFARHWRPDLFLWDPCWPGAAVAARAAGAAQARLLWGQDYFAWGLDEFAARQASVGAALGEHPLVEAVAPVAERHRVTLDDELLRGQWTVNPTPFGVWLPARTRTVAMRWVPFSAQTPAPAWLYEDPGRPRIAVSLGLSQRTYMKGGWGHLPSLLDAVADLDVEVVATLNDVQLDGIDRVPDNVRLVDYLPLNRLLPTCVALVHHGGMGTYATAAALGVPQLITDSDVDQGLAVVGDNEGSVAAKHIESTVTARHVVEREAGLPLDIASPSAEAMRKQLVRVLETPSFAEGAAALHEDILATPTPAEAVGALERLTARRSARR
jgi:UDP:flavonoid glycosyltransferase YjiC (YdhE family)